ncbi:MAG: AAA family ATPase, partial [bacterium]|nr:AAA family ATPase [bacterium]
MRLASLRVRRLPGLDQPFDLEPGAGVNLLIGPNAAGKSSVARAVRDLLWPELRASQDAWLRADFRTETAAWTVTCDGAATAWLRDGQPSPAPTLPPFHLADCYRLAAPDLLGSHGSFDRNLATAIRTDMTGGYDLVGIAKALPRPTRQKVRPLAQALQSAREDVVRIDRGQQELAGRRTGEADLEARAAAAEAAGRRLAALEAHRACAAAARVRNEAAAALEALPAAMAKVRPDDADQLARLREVRTEHQTRVAETGAEIADLQQQITALALPDGPDPEAVLDRIASLAEACRRASHAADLADERHATLVRTLTASREARTGSADENGDILAHLQRILDTADAGLAAFAADLATPAPVPGSGRRFTALALLAGGCLAAVAGALPGIPSTILRLALAGGGAIAACGGALLLAAWSRAGALHERRRALSEAAETASRTRDETETRSEDLARDATAAAEAHRHLDTDLATFGLELAAWGLAAPATSASADAAHDELRGRLRRHGELAARLERSRRDLERAEHEAATAGDQAADLLRRLELSPDLEDSSPVDDLVDRHPAWLVATGDLRDAETALRRLSDDADRHAAATDLSLPEGVDLATL